ncbi:MAG: acyltransferase family protein, partial [Polyangiaceae bacterium]
VEGLRALAAYVVYVNHAYAMSWAPFQKQYPSSGLSWLSYFLVWGHLSVTFFIVISGFCLTLPVVRSGGLLRAGTKAFLKRRARRILPPYYGAVVLCLVLIATVIGKPTGTLWDVPIGVNWVAFISHMVLLQDLFGTSKINYVFWSIAVEWQIYFLFPLIVWSWRRFGPRVTVTGALVLGYALRFGFADTRVVRAAPQYIGCFALGVLAAYVARSSEGGYVRLRARIPWGLLALGALGCVGVMSRVWGFAVATERFHLLDLPTAIAAMCLLVSTSKPEGPMPPIGRCLAWRPLAWIGTFSYSVYLVHAPLLQILWQYVLHPAGLGCGATFIALMGPGAVAVLVVSYGFFKICEEPFMRPAGARVARESEGAPELGGA